MLGMGLWLRLQTYYREWYDKECLRAAEGLRGLPTRYNAIITMDENRCAKNPESVDYQLVLVLQHPGPRKGKGLTQGHTTTWRQRLCYSVLSQPVARFCVKNPGEGGVKLRRE